MITSGSLPFFENSTHEVSIMVDSPLTGFEFSLMKTGSVGSAFKTANLVTISGKEGYLFDQSGNFFGGYESGVPFDLKINYDYQNKVFSYYKDDNLMANALDTTGWNLINSDGVINLIMFDKHGDSSLSINSTGAVGIGTA